MRHHHVIPALVLGAAGCLDLNALQSGSDDMAMPVIDMAKPPADMAMKPPADMTVKPPDMVVPPDLMPPAAWQKVYTSTGVHLNAISGIGGAATTIFVAGDAGAFIKGSGAAFTKTTATGAANLQAVWVASAMESWVADDSPAGKVLVTTDGGTNFTDKTASSTKPLRSIFGKNNTDVLTVGDNQGIATHWNNTNWLENSTTLTNKLHGVWASTTTYYIVGEGGDSAKALDPRSTWTKIPGVAGSPFMRALYGLNDTMIWGVTDNGNIISYDAANTKWVAFANLTGTPSLRGIWVKDALELWVVGSSDIIQKCVIATATCSDTTNSNTTAYNMTGIWGDAAGGIWAVGNKAADGAIFKF